MGGIFIQEIYRDPVGGDKESILCNGISMTLDEFQILEPEFKELPSGITGFKYIPGETHYFYNDKGTVVYVDEDVDPIVPVATLDRYISKTEDYVKAQNSQAETLETNNWDQGTPDKNRKRRNLEIKSQCWHLLNGSDWYIVRKSELGAEVPEKVQAYRNGVRKAAEDAETELNKLSDVLEIKNLQPVWPEWDYVPE